MGQVMRPAPMGLPAGSVGAAPVGTGTAAEPVKTGLVSTFPRPSGALGRGLLDATRGQVRDAAIVRALS